LRETAVQRQVPHPFQTTNDALIDILRNPCSATDLSVFNAEMDKLNQCVVPHTPQDFYVLQQHPVSHTGNYKYLN